ncbi:VCBS repeat-containing protein [Negadavirga shengliensis]|uniref:VCBS repeat-containing protein n=1 Tax=Negadavirga shengliensis TaxID=1389218 RepID=A0ABV9SZC0_9BACT
MRNCYLYFLLSWMLCGACGPKKEHKTYLFELLPAARTGIDFANYLKHNEQVNPYTFRNFYNGAGVALGDINNDGLTDIFFAGNQGENRLYLNKGDFEFEDITEKAGVASPGVWSTGVSMADVNGDGLLDIYVCKSGPPGGPNRHNQLFINNGDLTFTDKAHEYGIAEEGLSQHAVFFDFDLDGDLDMYLLSNSLRSVGIYDLREGQREIRDTLGGNKLYRNDGDKFTDVSEEAGIYGSVIGYGLGVTVADINKDGWPDLYVSNDFFEKDYLYINNQDGTFSEMLEEMLEEISMGAMGADIADLNNNGLPDIFVTEMLPDDWERVKTKTPFEDWDKYRANVEAGYYHQFTRNTLQKNLGPKPGENQMHFSEIARMSGVHATDWSWGALIFDMDNDGLKDIFVANGIAKDLTDFDYVDFYADDFRKVAQLKRDSLLLTSMIDEFPSVPIPNFLFKNKGGFSFENMADSLGMFQSTFSNGAAYGDLDNDGDLDLVVSNINGPAFIFKNNTDRFFDHHFLQLELGGHFGTKVMAYAGEDKYYVEHYPVKGYMSSMDHKLHLGLGNHSIIDSLEVIWPGGRVQKMFDVPADQLLVLAPNEGEDKVHFASGINGRMHWTPSVHQLPFVHRESEYVDFDRDRLRFYMISNEGPRAAVADVNGNGLDDVFLTGAKGQPSSLFLQQSNGFFRMTQQNIFEEDALAEDVDALFFDADGDGDLDLYVASGGIEFNNNTPVYQDRLYINDGKGNFKKAVLPSRFQSTSFVKALDFNHNGHLDLLVGTRAVPSVYGLPVDVILLENDGTGKFADVTDAIAPDFRQIGMTRDAWTGDLDGDGHEEIILVGEWMPLKLFKWTENGYKDISGSAGLHDSEGLWQRIEVADFNQDGHLDIIAGNWGLNSRLQASKEAPLALYINDFDENGTVEHILTMVEKGKRIPLVLKNSLLRQLPGLRKQLLKYDNYKDKSMEDLFSREVLENSLVLEAKTLETKLYLNDGNGGFHEEKLPFMVQSSPVYGIVAQDINHDGYPDIIIGGNQSKIKPELGSMMGNYGMLLENTGAAQFNWVEPALSGIYVKGEVRDIKPMRTGRGTSLLFTRNNDAPLILDWSGSDGPLNQKTR